jgi:hypothetical protein
MTEPPREPGEAESIFLNKERDRSKSWQPRCSVALTIYFAKRLVFAGSKTPKRRTMASSLPILSFDPILLLPLDGHLLAWKARQEGVVVTTM